MCNESNNNQWKLSSLLCHFRWSAAATDRCIKSHYSLAGSLTALLTCSLKRNNCISKWSLRTEEMRRKLRALWMHKSVVQSRLVVKKKNVSSSQRRTAWKISIKALRILSKWLHFIEKHQLRLWTSMLSHRIDIAKVNQDNDMKIDKLFWNSSSLQWKLKSNPNWDHGNMKMKIYVRENHHRLRVVVEVAMPSTIAGEWNESGSDSFK